MFALLALNTGCRKSELTGLTWAEVDLHGRRLTLEGSRTKSGRRRIVPLNQQAVDALIELRKFRDTHCPNSPHVLCTKSGRRIKDPRKGVANALHRAGIENFRVHDLRHTFASWLVQRDVSLYQMRDLLGHSTIKMTERYAHLVGLC